MFLSADLKDITEVRLRDIGGRKFQQSICRHEKVDSSFLDAFKGFSK